MSASSTFSGKFADPTTTLPVLPLSLPLSLSARVSSPPPQPARPRTATRRREETTGIRFIGEPFASGPRGPDHQVALRVWSAVSLACQAWGHHDPLQRSREQVDDER